MNIRSLIIALVLMLSGGCDGQVAYPAYRQAAYHPGVTQDIRQNNRQDIKQTIKPYTIMVYMNGSDLESEIGAATEDLIEMLESGLRSQNANIVILTGGAKQWQNDVIPNDECALWYIEDGRLFEIKRIGLQNMGDPDTLADFITFAMGDFPADKYGLVLWDHGGGAIAGYGHDEKFDYNHEGSLTLPEMDYAFKKAGLSDQKLEWMGFDACLMATVEMAAIASQYARYLVASEDLEPGDGWDYKFLSLLNRNPQASGYVLGREIVDTFMAFYGPHSDEILTLSVVDLNKIQPIMEAMGLLMEQCSDKLLTDQADFELIHGQFAALAKRRRYTKTFGEGSPRDNQSDMVDIGDMVHQLSDLFPGEAEMVLTALDDAVMYNRYNSRTPLYGLSAYYVYGGPFYESLDLYAQLDVDEAYIQYLLKFFDRLTDRVTRSRTIQHDQAPQRNDGEIADTDLTLWKPVMGRPGYYQMLGIRYDNEPHTEEVQSDLLWPYIDGRPVNLYRTARSLSHTQYAVPARINGRDCDIIVCLREEGSEGKILGYRCTEESVKQKGYCTLKPGDRVSLYYPVRRFHGEEGYGCQWIRDGEIKIKEPPALEWKKARGEHYYCFKDVDVYGLEWYGALSTAS